MKQYVVDAFPDQLFGGNPAAVCVMESWLPDDLLLKITRENNLSETAFAVMEGDHFHLRWFTPGGEIDLCGHATLATAYVILRYIHPSDNSVHFETKSGTLIVNKHEELFEMDFPAYELRSVAVTDAMAEAIGSRPLEAYIGRDLVCVMDTEATVRNSNPDMNKLLTLDGLLLHITAKGASYDCVSRSFAPKLSVSEDPVCGSGHCHLFPYWSQQLHKDELVAFQASERGGVLYGRVEGGRVKLSGKAVLFSEATFYVD